MVERGGIGRKTRNEGMGGQGWKLKIEGTFNLPKHHVYLKMGKIIWSIYCAFS